MQILGHIKVGEEAPNFTLTKPLCLKVSLYKELENGPVVLTFYRGSWLSILQLKAPDLSTIFTTVSEAWCSIDCYHSSKS
uniref:Uncharacterized protein n=1 Tax=Virgibacillus oceani TaxID=1479511 RepID=A0A917HFX2_9BACI|nr:hypothetical protein GCM10011398_23270 [Virgibacillus oceani]